MPHVHLPLQGCPGICQVLDYGLTEEAYWIVMRKYRCSLAEWRTRQSLGPANAAAACLYLSILLQVLGLGLQLGVTL